MERASILDYCDQDFANNFMHVDETRILFAGFIDAMAIVSFVMDGEMRLELEGPGFADLFGAGYADGVRDLLFLVDRQDRAELTAACKAARTAQEAVHVDIAWEAGAGTHAGDGENFFNTVVSIVCVGRKDDAYLMYFAFKDVSARRSAEHMTARSQLSSALRALFDEIFLLNLDTGSSEPIYAGGRPLVKEDGSPIDTGFHAIFRTVHRDDIRLFWKYSNYTFVETELFGPNPPDAITFDLRRSDESGAFHWERIFISRVASADNHKNVLVCVQNIDEQKDAQRRERELLSRAQTDALCGIYNRGTSEELIRAKLQALTAEETVTFAIIDVDDFKRVNDTYGHAIGDKVLCAVADSVRRICREDDIVGRLGGDEFIALLCGTGGLDKAELALRFERCKNRMREDSEKLGIEPPVTLSIGIVSASAGETTYNEVYERADSLLYEAKRSGKNAMCFEV